MNRVVVVILAAVALLMPACASAPQKVGSAAPDMAVAPAPEASEDTKQALASEVEQLERLLQGSYREDFGVEAPPASTESLGSGGGSDDGETSCRGTCQLSEAVCVSSEKICGIAERYPEEGSFSERCTWAMGHCTEATEQCDSCQES